MSEGHDDWWYGSSKRIAGRATAVAASLAVATAGCGGSGSTVLSTGDLPAIVGQPPKAEGGRGDWTPWEQFETKISRKDLGQSPSTKKLLKQGFVAGEARAWKDYVNNTGISAFLFEDAAGARSGLDTLKPLLVDSFKGDGTVEITIDEIDAGKLGDASTGWHVKGGDEGFYYLWHRDNVVYVAFMQAIESDLTEPELVSDEARIYVNEVDRRADAVS